MQRAIHLRESEGRFDAPDYQAALGEFYGRYVWRHPVQADLDSILATVNEHVYNYMQGPSEFTITGTLKTYDVTPQLGAIRVPTLYTVGEFDEADPPTIRHFAALTPGAEVVVLRGAAHSDALGRASRERPRGPRVPPPERFDRSVNDRHARELQAHESMTPGPPTTRGRG